MEINEVIGIDVSKLTLDCCIHNGGSQNVFVNNPQGINKLLEWVLAHTDIKKEQVLFVFENTGLYSFHLTAILHGHGCNMSVASGLEIRRSLGLARGKDDKSDAKRIALYGYRIRDEIKLYQMPNMA
ncbi:transposase [Gelidibacter sp. F2691]|nr:transposase [Gelidibacter sp. F2691]